MESTLLHADITQRAVVSTSKLEWINSPAIGVQRRMVERNGAEQARATSIVKYAAGAKFASRMNMAAIRRELTLKTQRVASIALGRKVDARYS
jgi:anti-sigma factor ChrR (cupin superfamily)